MHTLKTGLLGAALLLGGCASAGDLGLQAQAVSTEKSGHVAVYLSVSDQGKPKAGLSAEDFTVYEDGNALSFAHTGQMLLDKTDVSAHHTVLLVDNSEATSPALKKEILLAVTTFVSQVQATQSVSVYGFDGSERPRLLGEFAQTSRATPPRELAANMLEPRDRSRDLNSALLFADEKLTHRLERSGKTVQVGSLVVFAGGPDLAGRVSTSAVNQRLRQTPHRVFGISFGQEQSGLSRYVLRGYFEGFSAPVLALAFEEVGHHVHALYDQEYLLSYCSPARAGERELRIEARVVGPDGQEKRGGVSSSFQANGFGAGCNASLAPTFQVASAH